MVRVVRFALIALPLVACVTTGKYQKEVDRANAATKQAQATQAQLDDAHKTIDQQKADIEAGKKALAAEQAAEDELRKKIKADEDQIASIQKSNKELTQSLEAKRSDLAKKVADLIKDRDALAQQLADVTKAKDAQLAELNKQLADAKAREDDLQKEKDAEVARVKKSYEDVTAGLKSEIENGKIKITQLQGKLTLNLVDKILFDSGEANVKQEGYQVLDHVADALKSVADKDIRIEGHTDNIPIRGELAKKFPSNWELSAARATAVARYLQDHDGMDPKRLSVAGYADTRPVAPNDTPESRALNRRIEIVLVPHEQAPVPVAPATTPTASATDAAGQK